MRRLELKDIAAYLPYRLNVITEQGYHETLYWVSNEFVQLKNWTIVYDLIKIKPALRPMSDLTKEIVIEGYNNGEPFVPEKVINMSFNTIYNEIEIIDFNCVVSSNSHLTMLDMYGILDLLNQWHFDYRNLIDQGLAIDINTTNKQQ